MVTFIFRGRQEKTNVSHFFNYYYRSLAKSFNIQ
uniref:Uncharacterized protein n=1 Tax=Panagrolaimus sp. ES5 TaxID=591445 RepID=A0AC34G5C8_9BILA